MRTLRLFRNIAVLFILVMGLLASRPGPAVAHTNGKSCGPKLGFTCSTDASGNCHEERCGPRDFLCLNIGCV